MIDPAAVAVVHDPLVIALVVFSLGGLLTHILFRRHPLGRAMVRVIFLAVLTVILLRAGIVPYQPLQLTGDPFQDAVRAVLKIAWWLWTAWFFVGFLRAFVVTEHRPRESKLVQDLLVGLVYLAALFAIISYVFDLPIKGLLATSGAIAIILGLALQSTLSDVFSGIVLNFSRPYRPGDWISIDSATDGRVIEMNWRATHVLTAKRDLAIIPNSTIAKAKIVNSSSPSGIHGFTVTVQLDAKASPATGTEILEQAILNSSLIVATPAPTITVKAINAGYTEFDITAFVEELAQSTRAQNQLFDLISRHLAAADIALASNQSQPTWPQPADPAERKSAAERALDLLDLFAGLTAEERRALAAKVKRRTYDRGETVVEAGTIMRSFYVVGAGVLSLTHDMSEGEMEVMRLGPGDHFGESGLLTGAPASVKISALTSTTLYEMAKDDLGPVLEARPAIAHELCQVLARRQAAGQLVASPDLDKSIPANRVAGWFSDRLHRLFDLAAAE
jgi:small-conductance mechanosensitive channel